MGTSSPKKQNIFIKAQEEWKTIRNLNEETIQNKINNYLQTPLRLIQYTSFTPTLVISNEITKQECAEKQLNELNELYNRQKLKKHAAAQAKSQAKKYEALKTRREVIRYDSLEHFSFFLLNPDLSEQMHLCIEFGTAAKKRQKEIIKVCTISHLKKEMEEKYQIYISCICLYTYTWLRRINSSNAKRHHHPMAIQINSVSRNEMPEHIDEHYCLQIVKNAKQFADAFASHSVIISQDDKAKVLLRILAVGRTFKTVQSSHEPVAIPGSKQKLIPSVYLTINPEGSNDSLHNENPVLNNMLKLENEFKPILVLLVDELNLDYLTVRTYASGQSAYNPVECSMSTLLEKLAGIVLPIDHFGSHLDSNSIIENIDLAKQNFCYADKKLCDIW
ncbi:7807_t:CDS:2 [Cetraspora pellucida]|uniref:7807_t:CDS:1 n=1 Tax=Cetraspora pellucida TaxID=1433469 RepID=A0A9N9IT48_9GLOM|nr:7807_t:CDS:2 [Cetraspora pellucida]